MALENIYPITVNTKKKMFRDIPEIVANDNVVFEITIYDDAVLFPFISGYTAKFVSLKLSGKSVIRDATITDGVVRVVLGSSEMLEPGKVEGTVQIFDANLKRISTAKFDYVVKKDPSLQGGLPTDDKTLVIANEQVMLDAIDRSNLAMSRLDTQLTAATILDETKDIRVRTDGSQAPSAGAYVRELASNLAESSSIEKSIIQNFYDTSKAFLIFVGIDSLTNGAGGTKWLDYFAPRLRGELGDGGAGYVAFDNSSVATNEFSLGHSTGVQDISSLTPGQSPAVYSLDNKGQYVSNGSNATIDANVKRKYKYAKIFYLIQPGGGTFDVGYLSTFSSTKVTVNTDGTLALGSVSLPTKPDGQAGDIAFRSINGNVTVFGGLFTNDNGIAISRLGKGGDKFAWHNSTDNTFRTAWVQGLQPSLYIFNGGMNDRNDMTASAYEISLNNYLGTFKNNGCQLVLLRPNDPSDTSNNLSGFEEKLKAFAKSNKCGYVSNKKLLGGDYVTANSNGFMYDGVHPNVDGNKKISNNLLSYLSVPIVGLNKTELNGGGATAVQQPYTQLTSKKMSITTGTTQTIYKIGLTNSYPSGVLTLNIIGQRNGSTHTCKKRIEFAVNNGTTMNNGNSDNMIATTLYQYSPSGQPAVDFTVSYAKVNGLLEIYLTPNTSTYDMNFYIDGDVKLTYLAVTGQSVFEN